MKYSQVAGIVLGLFSIAATEPSHYYGYTSQFKSSLEYNLDSESFVKVSKQGDKFRVKVCEIDTSRKEPDSLEGYLEGKCSKPSKDLKKEAMSLFEKHSPTLTNISPISPTKPKSGSEGTFNNVRYRSNFDPEGFGDIGTKIQRLKHYAGRPLTGYVGLIEDCKFEKGICIWDQVTGLQIVISSGSIKLEDVITKFELPEEIYIREGTEVGDLGKLETVESNGQKYCIYEN